MRVYVASTKSGLNVLRHSGFSAPFVAHAVTGALREWYAEGDADELEYAASADAADASLRLLVAGEPCRRVVVAAEVPDAWVQPHASSPSSVPSSVLVSSALTLDRVVSVHLDDADAEADLVAAVAALPAADAGDEDARFTVDGAQGHELLWYDVTELDDVLFDQTEAHPWTL